ncbi:nuclear transport factor 2 family protein [Myroides marinus]|uniref:nuclear transport factor 2 family protein n=1 Tax=Myroides marinus TaxID=703342 RepID=UPI002577B970|nr:nuclear transport factor 2 family protein [Myroides marinus]MDM1375228.1 nuclear transport factor 2 family protein [Myroides marinus]
MTNSSLDIVKKYYEFVNKGDFGEDTYYKLFAEDVELFYPKFGYDKGREGIKRFTKQIKQVINALTFEMDKFNFIAKDNYVTVEGHEFGQTSNGVDFPNHTTSFGKFVSVFDVENGQIKRMHCYVDPDLAGQDKMVTRLFKEDLDNQSLLTVDQQTEQVVNQFYDLLLGKVQGDIIDLFADEIDWDLPGNETKFPWLGKKTTKQQVKEEFFDLHPQYVEPIKFEVEFIAVNGVNATATGYLSSKILKSDKVFNSSFVGIFKVINGKITKYHFLEDSYKLDTIQE